MQLLMLDLSGGALAGVAVGFALKKAFRAALLVMGLAILVLYGMAQVGYVTVHWESLTLGIESGARNAADWVWTATRELSVALVGFGGGLLFGLKMKS